MAQHKAGSQPGTKSTVSAEFAEQMRDAVYAASSLRTAQRVWDEIFTPQEKVQLGRTLPEAIKTFSDVPRMWVKMHGGTISRAVVEILAALEAIGAKKRRWMLQQLGEEGEDTEASKELAIQSGYLVLADAPRAAYPWAYKSKDRNEAQLRDLLEYLKTL